MSTPIPLTEIAAPMPTDAFADWAMEADGRWELIGGLPLRLMTEGREHRRVKTALVTALSAALPPGAPCQPEGDGSLILIPGTGNVVSPDDAIQCGDEQDGAILANPVVVFEVAVTSIERDLGEKRVAYLTVPSIQHVVVIIPGQRQVIHFRKGEPEPRRLSEGPLYLDPPGITLNVADLWARL